MQQSPAEEQTQESNEGTETAQAGKDGPTEDAKQMEETGTDSGWAWVVLCGAFLVYFNSIGFFMSLSVYLPLWMDYFETNSATVGLVVSIGTLWRGIVSKFRDVN